MRLAAGFDLRPPPQPGKPYLLYIHVPFCESLCPFCSFHRVRLNRALAQRYFAALQCELQVYSAAGFRFSDIYVGGGTPTVLPEALAETLALARRLFDVSRISVETNPNHLRGPVLDILNEAGVNRLSVGVQSLDDGLLNEMERAGPYGDAAQIRAGLARAEGRFETFNVDMIFNLPHQDMAALLEDVHALKALNIDQLSWYPLMPAATTERAMSKHMGRVAFARERAMYEAIVEALTPDYRPGSAWCFSRTCAAIDEYIVDHDEYLGIGSGAFSYAGGVIYSSSFSINRYLDLVESGHSAITASRALSVREQAQYDFLIRLFGLSMDKAALEAKYGAAYRRLLAPEIALFKALGAVRETPQALHLTRTGMYYWVLMMREFFIGVNNFRAQMRQRIGEERQALARVS